MDLDSLLFGGLPGLNPSALASMDDELVRDMYGATPMYEPGRSPEERTEALLESLPKITEKRLKELGQSGSSCSICLQPFLSILAEQETAEAMDSPAYANHELGVSQLDKEYQCGHLFCRKDLVKWIQEMKETCPMCRKNFFDPNAEEDKPKMLVFGGTPRLIEFYRNAGINAEIAQVPTQDSYERRREDLMRLFS